MYPRALRRDRAARGTARRAGGEDFNEAGPQRRESAVQIHALTRRGQLLHTFRLHVETHVGMCVSWPLHERATSQIHF